MYHLTEARSMMWDVGVYNISRDSLPHLISLPWVLESLSCTLVYSQSCYSSSVLSAFRHVILDCDEEPSVQASLTSTMAHKMTLISLSSSSVWITRLFYLSWTLEYEQSLKMRIFVALTVLLLAISLKAAVTCQRDTCYNQIAAQRNGGPDAARRRSDCSSVLR